MHDAEVRVSMVRVRCAVIAWAHGAVSTTCCLRLSRLLLRLVCRTHARRTHRRGAAGSECSAPPRSCCPHSPHLPLPSAAPHLLYFQRYTTHKKHVSTRYLIQDTCLIRHISYKIHNNYIRICIIIAILCVYILCQPDLCTSKIFYCGYYYT